MCVSAALSCIKFTRRAARRCGDVVGDGTSTATILAHAIFADGVRNVVAGASAIDLKRGLDRGAKAAVEALRTMARPVRTRKEKAQVAAISAHNDDTVGELVAEAMEKVGGEGVITVEESKTTETTLEIGGHQSAIWTRQLSYTFASRGDEEQFSGGSGNPERIAAPVERQKFRAGDRDDPVLPGFLHPVTVRVAGAELCDRNSIGFA
jgi:hypothetical protein